jgi:hypothetical protein
MAIFGTMRKRRPPPEIVKPDYSLPPVNTKGSPSLPDLLAASGIPCDATDDVLPPVSPGKARAIVSGVDFHK